MSILMFITLFLMGVCSLAGWFLAGHAGAIAGAFIGVGALIALLLLFGRD